MADVTIYGVEPSTYVRTARMACVEKGVSYDLEGFGEDVRAGLKSAEHLERHPFGRMPALVHGDKTIFETSAICRYLDHAFGGPALVPSDPLEAVRMDEWVSAANDYIISNIVQNFIFQFLFPSGPGGEVDEAKVDETRPVIREHMEILDRALQGRTFIAGDGPSVADLLLIPPCHYVGLLPGGMASFEGLDNLYRWWGAMAERKSFSETVPPLAKEQQQAAE